MRNDHTGPLSGVDERVNTVSAGRSVVGHFLPFAVGESGAVPFQKQSLRKSVVKMT